MKITDHFDDWEFTCKCGCKGTNIDVTLVKKLENLFAAVNADKIIITSGYRCPAHSVAVGGYADDAHTRGIAADCEVWRNGSIMKSEEVAAIAEDLGFTGIGLMNGAVHLDIRNSSNYKNAKWFGDERNDKSYSTFKSYLPDWYKKEEKKEKKHNIKVLIDGVVVYEGEV